MSNDTTGLIRQGIAAFKAGDRAQAAKLFHQVIQTDPQSQMAWLWLAGCLEDDNEKQQCLERARDIDPNNEAGKRAAQGLASIQSKPQEDDIPFPDFADSSQQSGVNDNRNTTTAQRNDRTSSLPSEQERSATRNSHRDEEVVICKSKYHWSVMVGGIVLAALCFLFAIPLMLVDDITVCGIGGILTLIGGLLLVYRIEQYASSEFIVTNKRIINNTGFIKRTSIELLHTKAEAIYVNQGLIERMFGSGTIIVGGSGGTKNPFLHIANAAKIRSAIQEQISIVQDRRM